MIRSKRTHTPGGGFTERSFATRSATARERRCVLHSRGRAPRRRARDVRRATRANCRRVTTVTNPRINFLFDRVREKATIGASHLQQATGVRALFGGGTARLRRATRLARDGARVARALALFPEPRRRRRRGRLGLTTRERALDPIRASTRSRARARAARSPRRTQTRLHRRRPTPRGAPRNNNSHGY